MDYLDFISAISERGQIKTFLVKRLEAKRAALTDEECQGLVLAIFKDGYSEALLRSPYSPSGILRQVLPQASADRLRSMLITQIAALVNRVGASPRSVQVRELGYRWGSCGYKGDLYFHAPCGDAAANHD